MKMLFVVNGFPSAGHNIHTLNLARALHGSHDITLVCFRLDSPFAKEAKYFREVRVIDRDCRSFVSKCATSVITGIPFCILGFESKAMQEAIRDVCRRDRYDLAFFEPLVMGQYHLCVGQCPVVLFPVDATSRIKEQRLKDPRDRTPKALRYLDYWMVRRYEAKLYAQCDAIVFASKHDSEFTVRNVRGAKGKVYTMPEAVDLDYFRPASEEGDGGAVIAFLGGMGNYPNYQGAEWFYTQVWRDLKREQRGIQLYIVGDDPQGKMRTLCKSDPDVTVTGYVDDVRPFLARAAVFISPLQIGTGMKNKMLQAMAMGKAIVASPLSVEGIDLDPGDHCVVADGAPEFREKIVSLLTNRDLRTEMGKRARRFVEERHTLKEKGDRFMNIVREVSRR
jgi:glycosyltransferase involved in cell wall biosynthesis